MGRAHTHNRSEMLFGCGCDINGMENDPQRKRKGSAEVVHPCFSSVSPGKKNHLQHIKACARSCDWATFTKNQNKTSSIAFIPVTNWTSQQCHVLWKSLSWLNLESLYSELKHYTFLKHGGIKSTSHVEHSRKVPQTGLRIAQTLSNPNKLLHISASLRGRLRFKHLRGVESSVYYLGKKKKKKHLIM